MKEARKYIAIIGAFLALIALGTKYFYVEKSDFVELKTLYGVLNDRTEEQSERMDKLYMYINWNRTGAEGPPPPIEED